jgi:hypothetical protein
MPLPGTRIHIAYPSGLELDAEYGDGEVHWSVTAGPPAGRSGTNATHVAEVAPNIHFINWIEDNGTTITQLLDLNASVITTFVTFDSDGRRASTFQRGTIRRI